MKSGDVSALQRIEADSYKFTNPEGVTTTKQDDVNGLKSGHSKYESFELSDLKAQVNGDTATVTGKAALKGTENGKDVSGNYDFVDTFKKIDGTWQAVSTKSTKSGQ
jgi:ketosteroid isomerase-like protein